jgi:NAD(P)-dependent dehydrogenase (short-subunit alcohol dehydrogenase family)
VKCLVDQYESFKKLFYLEGKKAIITGAGGGIGSSIANGFAEFGIDIALLDLNLKNITEEKQALDKKFNINVIAKQVDVCNVQKVNSIVHSVLEEFESIDILVNCHGIAQCISSEEMVEKDWMRMIDVNLKGVFLMCQTVGRHMIKRGKGKIVNIASMSGTIVNYPQPQAHYNTSKAGVMMLTKSLAVEWAKYNINVNSISPGYTRTKMVNQLLKKQPDYEKYWISQTPLGRLASPLDIVGAVIFLSSDAANFVTGHDLIVDGGYTIL